MKLTGTNKPITYTTHTPPGPSLDPQGKCEDQMLSVHYAVPNQQPGKPQLHNKHDNVPTNLPPTPVKPGAGPVHRVTAVIAWGKRPVPFRTRKLRPTAPMVLHPRECGRVGHRRTTINAKSLQQMLGALPRLTLTVPFVVLSGRPRRPLWAVCPPALPPLGGAWVGVDPPLPAATLRPLLLAPTGAIGSACPTAGARVPGGGTGPVTRALAVKPQRGEAGASSCGCNSCVRSPGRTGEHRGTNTPDPSAV